MSRPKREPSLPALDPKDFDKYAVFGALGYEPDDWQKLFHDAEQRHRILACGVRVGKTFGLYPEGVAATLRPSMKTIEEGEWVGSRGWIVAPTYDIADKLFLQVARALRKHFPWLITRYSERERIVRTVNGGYVQAKSSDNPDSLIAEELDWAILDEAPRIKDRDMEQVRQRLITRQGWFAAIGSPVPCKWFERSFEAGQGNGYNYEFVGKPMKRCRYAGRRVKFVPGRGDNTDDDYFSMRVPTHANKRLDLKMLAEWEKNMPERVFREDALAEFMGNAGRVFRGFDRLCTATRQTHAQPNRRYVIGWDIARAQDYSAICVMDYESREEVFVDRFQGPWDHQYERVISICRRFNRPDLIIDATSKGDPVAEELIRRNNEAGALAVKDVNDLPPGITREKARLGPFANRIEPFQITNNRIKRDLIEALVVSIDQGEITILDDPIQTQEIRVYEYKQSDTTGVIRYGAPAGFHDDTVIALALANWRCTRPMGTTKFVM